MGVQIKRFTIDGETVWIQVGDRDDGEIEPTSGGSGAIDRVVRSVDIQGTLRSVMNAAGAAASSLNPSELTVELKLGFKADAGVFIASTSADASVTVKAVWRPAAGGG